MSLISWFSEDFLPLIFFFSVLCWNSLGLWQIGRIPNEWGRCLLPLVRDKKVTVEGCCKYAPDVLSIMDTIELSIRYAHSHSQYIHCLCLTAKNYLNVTLFVWKCMLLRLDYSVCVSVRLCVLCACV